MKTRSPALVIEEMNYPAASCEVSLAEFIDLIEASFEEFDPTRLN